MSIFVSIVAYRDPVLRFTLRRAYERAKWPDQLHFGIVDQSAAELRLTDTAPVPPKQVTIVHIDPAQARGPCWARALAMTLYRGETWYFQIDSHMDFEPEWDAIMIGQAQALQATQPGFVISSYPPAFELIDGEPVRRASTEKVLAHVVKPGATFDPAHLSLPFEAHPVEQDRPVRGFHLGAGCLFAPGEFVERFPYDPYLYFQGEEQALAARLFTHGWDIYHMAGLPVSHLYMGDLGTRPLHWDEKEDEGRAERWWKLDKRSRRRLGDLLVEGRDLGAYGLGRERTLDDYAKFSGIDYARREIAAVAYRGPWNEPGQRRERPAVPESGFGAALADDPAETRPLDDRWTSWLTQNLARGCDPEELLGIVLEARFSLASVRAAMGSRFPADSTLLRAAAPPPDYAAISRPPLLRDPRGLALEPLATDRLQLYAIDGFLSASECDALADLVDRQLAPSTGAGDGAGCHRGAGEAGDLRLPNTPLVAAIDEKIARTLGIRREYAEEIQARRHDAGQEFGAHTDYFEPGSDEFARFGGRRGNRTWTFMVCLEEGVQGGGTRFFALDRVLPPKKGRALAWNNLRADGTPNPETLHCAMPVRAGREIVITKWFRARGAGPMFYGDR
jgi:hypothetical protein